jgi:hypothetical protein
MQITKLKLKIIIKEELQKILQEQAIAGSGWGEYPETLARPISPYEPEWDEDSPFEEVGQLAPGPRPRFNPDTAWPTPEPGPVPWPVPEVEAEDPDSGRPRRTPEPVPSTGWPDPERPGAHPDDRRPPQRWYD